MLDSDHVYYQFIRVWRFWPRTCLPLSGLHEMMWTSFELGRPGWAHQTLLEDVEELIGVGVRRTPRSSRVRVGPVCRRAMGGGGRRARGGGRQRGDVRRRMACLRGQRGAAGMASSVGSSGAALAAYHSVGLHDVGLARLQDYAG